MTTVTLENDILTVTIEGFDRFFALRNKVQVHANHIVQVGQATDKAKKWLQGIRLGGSHIPGVISAGIFYERGGLVFWDVHHADNAIFIALKNEQFKELVIEVRNPAEVLEMIKKAYVFGAV